jgi:hypothetical protein
MSRSAEEALDANDDAGSMELIGDTPDKPTEEKPDKPPEDKPNPELETLKAQLASEKEKSDYWKGAHQRATQRPTTSRLANDEGKDPEADVEEEDEEDLVEILAKGNKKKIKAAFGKLGFVSKDEVDKTLNEKWATVETAAQVQARHPDITNAKSELHQETLRQIESLREQGIDTPNLLGIAADLAYTQLVKTGRIKSAKEDTEETDLERIERIGSQQGQIGRGRRNPSEGADSEELTPSQKFIAKKFGLSNDTYAKRASKGVRLAGVPKG